MHIKESLINFLYDKEYFISIFENYIHVFNFRELSNLSSNKIILKMDTFTLDIEGNDLFITKMLPNEVLIKGTISKVGFLYE